MDALQQISCASLLCLLHPGGKIHLLPPKYVENSVIAIQSKEQRLSRPPPPAPFDTQRETEINIYMYKTWWMFENAPDITHRSRILKCLCFCAMIFISVRKAQRTKATSICYGFLDGMTGNYAMIHCWDEIKKLCLFFSTSIWAMTSKTTMSTHFDRNAAVITQQLLTNPWVCNWRIFHHEEVVFDCFSLGDAGKPLRTPIRYMQTFQVASIYHTTHARLFIRDGVSRE